MCVYFVDRSLGRHVVADALRGAGARVEVHDDHFRQDCPDQEWLAEVGRRGWVVLTKDHRIAYRTLERLAVAESNVRMLVLVGGDLSGEQMAAAFVRALQRMQRFAREHDPPFIAKVYRDGALKDWKSGAELLR
ncbi:MAG: hypothetical protein HYU66_27570 [Armatimonadetes bacterium]|nr:hypothetical protein [Armatimonadota bacterium]